LALSIFLLFSASSTFAAVRQVFSQAMFTFRWSLLRKSLVSLLFVIPVLIQGKPSTPSFPHEWRSYGGDPGGTRYSPLKQINRTNVARLVRAWTYHTGELNLGTARFEGGRLPSFECTPLVVDGVLYLSTPSSRVIALESE